MIDLSDIDKWVDYIAGFKKFDRLEDNPIILQKKGYDIITEAGKLCDIYMKLIEEKEE